MVLLGLTSLPRSWKHRFVTCLLRTYANAIKNVVFLRIDLWNFEGSFPVLSTVPYNETVYVDITVAMRRFLHV